MVVDKRWRKVKVPVKLFYGKQLKAGIGGKYGVTRHIKIEVRGMSLDILKQKRQPMENRR